MSAPAHSTSTDCDGRGLAHSKAWRQGAARRITDISPFTAAAYARKVEESQNSARIISGEDRNRTPQENTEKTGVLDQSGADSGARKAREAALPPELAAVVDAWPTLPAAIKAGVLAMIRTDRAGSSGK